VDLVDQKVLASLQEIEIAEQKARKVDSYKLAVVNSNSKTLHASPLLGKD
jgi:hypothetical protein